jgi:hypothetical protein
MSTDGKNITPEWITGFNSPKGMGIYRHQLYVADMDKIIIIDLHAGKIGKTIDVPGAVGLNDITIDPAGIVYVSDSKAKTVYKIENGVPSLFLKDLKGPNGLLYHNSTLFVLDGGGFYSLNADKTLKLISDGMDGGIDGIEHVKGNEYIISCWEGVIWYVNTDGKKEKLLDSRAEKKNTADLGFNPKTGTVYVPTFWKNTIVAYEVK